MKIGIWNRNFGGYSTNSSSRLFVVTTCIQCYLSWGRKWTFSSKNCYYVNTSISIQGEADGTACTVVNHLWAWLVKVWKKKYFPMHQQPILFLFLKMNQNDSKRGDSDCKTLWNELQQKIWHNSPHKVKNMLDTDESKQLNYLA